MSKYFFLILAATMFFLTPPTVRADICVNGTSYDDSGNRIGSCTSTAPGAGTPLPGNGGIFTCNQTGAYAMSVGSLNAVGGTFVPVSDNAVTLNTGYLVYKECVLRPVVAAQSHAINAAYVNAEMQQYLTGNNGNPYFLRNFGQEQWNTAYNALNSAFYPVTNNLNPAFQAPVQTALARGFAQQFNAPYASLSCPYSGNLASVLSGQTTDVWGGLSAMMNPACSPLSAYTLAQNQLNSNIAAAQYAWVTQLNWGNGTYAIRDANGNVITPGSMVNGVALAALLSGQQQLQNANDLGQVVNQFMAGMANRILSGSLGGLASLGKGSGATPSYLSQAVAASSQELGRAVTNVALSVLGPALTLEQQYNQVETNMASTLLSAITTLRSAESTCWDTIVKNVCAASSTPAASASGSLTCTAGDGSTLHIATSTAFATSPAQSVINTQIKPLVNAVAKNLANSNDALSAMNTLASGVQSTTDANAQKSALQQLDALVAQGLLHTQPDLDQANSQASTLSDSLNNSSTGLVPQTLHYWQGDGTASDGTPVSAGVVWDGSSTLGWCNAQNQTDASKQTLAKWAQRWEK